MSWLFMIPTAQADLEVTPTEYDCGEVELGSSNSTIITIMNTGYEIHIIDEVGFGPGSSPDFSITATPAPGAELMPGDDAEVEITYTPSNLGYASATLGIEWSNGGAGYEQVSLEGFGVEPSGIIIEAILNFFDESVGEGTLEGNGPGNSAEHRLNALRNMLLEAGRLIDEGDYNGACVQLNDAYKHCDGQDNPPDFVTGDAQAELANQILDLMEALNCAGGLAKRFAHDFEDEHAAIVTRFSLEQNHPNPFNPTTAISYSIPEDTRVKLVVYNTLGQIVAILVDEYQSTGNYAVEWNATNRPAGLYICRLEANGFTASKKMFLLK